MKIINWFEIPVNDMPRARQFYEVVLETQLREEAFGPQTMAVFPYDREGDATGGALVYNEGVNPTETGTLVYLNAGESLEALLTRVEPAGGKVVMPRTELPPGMGAIALITDTEGNRIGVHALK